jgi:hypothetical protein
MEKPVQMHISKYPDRQTMEKPVQMHISNNIQTPLLPNMITFISKSGHFWINRVVRAKN